MLTKIIPTLADQIRAAIKANALQVAKLTDSQRGDLKHAADECLTNESAITRLAADIVKANCESVEESK